MNIETKICQNCKQSFTIEQEDFAFYQKMKVPPPTFCPECRMIRRFLFRNEHFLFKNKDAITGKEIFAGFPSHSPYKVYTHAYWWSDAWDPMEYGKDYDFNLPFFEQLKELYVAVPQSARSALNLVNSDYSEQVSNLKNVYLGFDLDHAEDSAYLVNGGYVKDTYDILNSWYVELCYETTAVSRAYRVFFSYNCYDCNNVWFSKNCTGCSDCFGCVNLKSKKYHIFNKPYSKEEYFKKLESFDLGSFASLKKHIKEAQNFWTKFPVKYINGFRNVTSSGDYLINNKNVKESFMVQDTENSKFLQIVSLTCADSYDYTVWGEGSSQMYECLCCGLECDSIKFCFDCWPSCKDLEYCISCKSSSDCFGCVGLRNKKYCIFNKQYSKEAYFALREKIVEHMAKMPYTDSHKNTYRYGEFLPPELSPYSYNESLAQDIFPLTKEEATQAGHPWTDPESREYTVTMKAADLPDHINDVPPSITKEIIQCESCKKAYRIIEPELNFLTIIGLPLPRQCFECRLKRRFSYLNQPRLHQRKCQCGGMTSEKGGYANAAGHQHGESPCQNEFQTTYAPDRPEIVYCEPCYQSEVE